MSAGDVNGPYGFTILTKAPRAVATKVCTGTTPFGAPLFEPCGNGWLFNVTPRVIPSGDLDGLEMVLQELAPLRDRYIIRAGVIPGVDIAVPQRRLMEDDEATGGKKALAPHARAWVGVDVDGIDLFARFGLVGFGRPEKFRDGARIIVDRILGGNFAGVGCIATTTTQSAFVGDNVWRGRVWFLLSEPVPDTALHAYFKGLALAKQVEIDPSTCLSTQPNYTGRVWFAPDCGFSDPFTRDAWVQRISPARGCDDIVRVNAAGLTERYATEAIVEKSRIANTIRANGGGFEGRVAAIGGAGAGSFRTHIVSAIGYAVDADIPLSAVQEQIAARLAQCADAKRLRDYDKRHTARVYRDCARRTAAAEKRADDAVTRLNSILNRNHNAGANK